MANVKRILSLDGGGIRGVIPARILMEVERMTGKPIAETFDYIAGTSTGGILALCLTKPDHDGKPQFSAEYILDMYRTHGSEIFSRSVWHAIKSLVNLTGPKYSADGIEAMLQKYLEGVNLSQALSRTLIPAYSIDHRGPRFFKSWAVGSSPADDTLMWQVARATSAAPTYFPPFPLEDGPHPCTLIDGGVFANTPTMCVFADAVRSEPEGTVFKVLSIGTGTGNGTIDPKKATHWGGLFWVSPLLEILLDGSTFITDYEMEHILDPTEHEYLRLQVTMPGDGTAMDDVTTIPSLVKSAEDLLAARHQDLVDFLA